jgi:hypothetical protein
MSEEGEDKKGERRDSGWLLEPLAIWTQECVWRRELRIPLRLRNTPIRCKDQILVSRSRPRDFLGHLNCVVAFIAFRAHHRRIQIDFLFTSFTLPPFPRNMI